MDVDSYRTFVCAGVVDSVREHVAALNRSLPLPSNYDHALRQYYGALAVLQTAWELRLVSNAEHRQLSAEIDTAFRPHANGASL